MTKPSALARKVTIWAAKY